MCLADHHTLQVLLTNCTIVGAFDKAHNIAIQHINGTEAGFFRQRSIFDFAFDWMENHHNFTE
jgi:hypothetical protein